MLFIRGLGLGIYADVNVQLNIDLDALLEEDVGFAVPVGEVRLICFSKHGVPFLFVLSLFLTRRNNNCVSILCYFYYSLEEIPFITRAIETVVNQIRNRMTSVDLDTMLFPIVVLQHSHFWDWFLCIR